MPDPSDRKTPLPAGLLATLVAAGSVAAAAFIMLRLPAAPLPLRIGLAAMELLVATLVCRVILASRRGP